MRRSLVIAITCGWFIWFSLSGALLESAQAISLAAPGAALHSASYLTPEQANALTAQVGEQGDASVVDGAAGPQRHRRHKLPVASKPTPALKSFDGAITVGPGGILQGPHIGYGMNVQFTDAGDVQPDITLMQQAGFTWIKQQFAWKSIEPDRGNFNWGPTDALVKLCNANHIKIIARVDTAPAWAATYSVAGLYDSPPNNPQDFADFLTALATRYNGQSVVAYEIWNEPNLWFNWGGMGKVNPAAYVRLLKVAYTAIKRVNPALMVLSAGLASTGVYQPIALPDDVYLEGMYAAGVSPYFDGLGAHLETGNHPPELAIGADPVHAHPAFYFRRAEQLRAIMVRNGDANKQMWITEFGYTTDTIHPDRSWYAVSEQTKGEYLARCYLYAKTQWPWAGVMALWNLNFAQISGPTDEKGFWGVLNTDGSPRSSYYALKNIPK